VDEERGQFRNPRKGESPSLEAAPRGLVKRQQTEKTRTCYSESQSVRNSDSARVNCNYEL
jgi:hypothetical protein